MTAAFRKVKRLFDFFDLPQRTTGFPRLPDLSDPSDRSDFRGRPFAALYENSQEADHFSFGFSRRKKSRMIFDDVKLSPVSAAG